MNKLNLELVEVDLVDGGVDKVLVVDDSDGNEVMSIVVESDRKVVVWFGDLERIVEKQR